MRSAVRLGALTVAFIGVLGCSVDVDPAGLGHTTETSAGPTTEPATAPSTSAPSTSTPPAAGTALALLGTLEVKGRAPRTGYDRSRFGQAWADVDRNGCDTRNDILARDLRGLTVRPGTQGCLVEAGALDDPYTDRTITFVRGELTSADIQVDHVVALSDAWQKGAQQLTEVERTAFANDPLNLLAVDGPTNAAKGAGDAATWLPPNRGFRCAYVARQVAVKATHALWVTAAERDAIARVLASCPDQPVTDGADAPTGHPRPGPSPRATRRSEPSGPEVYFESCAAARSAGAAPLNRGTPGYRTGLDGDDDGVGCDT